jgi:4-aminobutyrate aminotransferase-like enzyme
VACAAALATLDVLEHSDSLANARRLGTDAVKRLRREVGEEPAVCDVRGVGLMIGVELVDKDVAQAVTRQCLADCVIVLSCGPNENVLRLVPPLTITAAELDHGLDTLISVIMRVR